MKILITGQNSYIGNSFKNWVNQSDKEIIIDQISLKNKELNTLNFRIYDVIFHVAGIAHISSNKKMIPEYFRVNRDLAINVAEKAKNEGVKHFVFLSSLAIYGDDQPIGIFTEIDINKFTPNNAYGQSKLEADKRIQSLSEHNFTVSILRIPMVYGKNAKGNFLKLFNFLRKLIIFPKINNKRSVIHIDNLNRLIYQLIKKRVNGIFFPQDKKYLNVVDMVKLIRIKNSILLTSFFNFSIKLISTKVHILKRVFGNKYYSQDISIINGIDYQIDDIESFIRNY